MEVVTLEPLRWNQQVGHDFFVEYLKDQRQFDRTLAAILRDAAREAERLVQRLAGDASLGATIRTAQYASSAAELHAMEATLWDQVEKETLAGIQRTSRIAVDYHEEIVLRLGRSLAPAVREGFVVSARHAVENVRSRYINQIRLSRLVYKNEKLASGKVDTVVNRGIALNKSAREIARDVRAFIRPDVRGGQSYAAFRLGRTELNNAFHTTSVRGYAAVPWVEGVKWNLSGSHPKADPCDDYAKHDDGNGEGVWPKGQVPRKPHPQCLCYTTAITVEPDEFVDRLLSGKYDRWLAQNGMVPLRKAG